MLVDKEFIIVVVVSLFLLLKIWVAVVISIGRRHWLSTLVLDIMLSRYSHADRNTRSGLTWLESQFLLFRLSN